MIVGIQYRLLTRRFLRASLPVVFTDVCQYAIDTEVRPGSKDSFTEGTVVGVVAGPVVAETGLAEAMATGCAHRTGKYVLT